MLTDGDRPASLLNNASTAIEHSIYVNTMNMMVRHGVRSALEYAQSGDIEKAR